MKYTHNFTIFSQHSLSQLSVPEPTLNFVLWAYDSFRVCTDPGNLWKVLEFNVEIF